MDETKVEIESEGAELENDGSLNLKVEEEEADGAIDEGAADGDTDESDKTGEDNAEDGEEDEEFDFEAELAKAFTTEEDEDEESDEKSGEGNGDADKGTDKDVSDADKVPEKPDGEESPEARELRELKAKYDKLERRSKDALKSLGIDETDAVSGLERLAREQSDMSESEYNEDLKRRDDEEEERRRTEAERAIAHRESIKAQIEVKKKADLAAIHAAYPASVKYQRLDDIPGFERFKELRDLGTTPEEAYAAVNPAGLTEGVVKANHKEMLNASKSHLKSVGGKSAGSTINIPRSEYKMIKSMLGDDVSDAEIAKYYKKVKG